MVQTIFFKMLLNTKPFIIYMADFDIFSFIEKQIYLGKSKQEITKFLISKGISKNDIYTTFEKIDKSDKIISDYVKENLLKGHTIHEISLHLKQNNVSDLTLRRGLLNSFSKQKPYSTFTDNQTFKYAFIILLFCFLIISIFGFSLSLKPTRLLDAKMTILNEVVRVNEPILVNLEIQNFGKSSRFDVIATIFIKGTTVSSTETFAVETNAVKTISLEVPSYLEKGYYDVAIEIIYGGETSAIVSKNIYINPTRLNILPTTNEIKVNNSNSEPINEIKVNETNIDETNNVNLVSINNISMQNISTINSSYVNTSNHIILTQNNISNNITTNIDDPININISLLENMTLQELYNLAISTNNLTICSQIIDSDLSIMCYNDISSNTLNITGCSLIKVSLDKDACYMNLASLGVKESCDYIQTTSMIGSCLGLIANLN